jgi:pimeloyl-ACP methyl ester carboxylesterase
MSVLRSVSIDQVLENRILALDPEHLGDTDVATLAAGPTPRIMLLRGGVYPVYLVMESFGEFLVGMGYPEAKIRDPSSEEWSYSPYDSTERLAGVVAWHYEHDALRPMLIGHSQGGLYAVKILKELAGQRSDGVTVRNPVTGANENRRTITDPLTGVQRPVIGTSVAYASALGAGGWSLVLPNQGENLATLWTIPESVDQFTGYFISGDLIALSFPGTPLDSQYVGSGKVTVRNVVLPADYSHITTASTRELARIPEVRDWINAFVPGQSADPSRLPGDAPLHVLWAADVWYSIKMHWCLEAQRLIRARRTLVSSEVSAGNGQGRDAVAPKSAGVLLE